MYDRSTWPHIGASEPQVVDLIASLAFQGGSTAPVVTGKSVTSAVRSGSGEYTVVFEGKGPLTIEGFTLQVMDTAARRLAFAVSYTSATRTLIFRTTSASAANTLVDLPNTATLTIRAVHKRTSI